MSSSHSLFRSLVNNILGASHATVIAAARTAMIGSAMMNIMVSTFFALMFLFVINISSNSLANSDEPTVLSLKTKTETNSDTIFLSDLIDSQILEADSLGSDEVRILKNTEVGRFSKPLTEITLTSGSLLKKIRGLDSSLLKSVRFKVPENVHVVLVKQDFAADLKSVMLGQLKSECSECDYEISKVKWISSGVPPAKQWRIEQSPNKWRGPTNLKIVYSNGGSTAEGTGFVSCDVRISRKVPVVRLRIQFGSRIQPGDVSYEKRDITFATDGWPAESELIGSKVKKAFLVGELVGISQLEKEKAVSKNEMVTVVSKGEDWSLSIKGLAQDSGFVGDVVSVLNPSTKRVLSGVVVARGTVEIK